MKDISLMELLKSGAHFGHTTSRWNPKMKSYIYAVRNNIHILDLEKTKKALEQAAKQVHDLAANGGTILFIGTKRQAKDSVRETAERAHIPYVSVRWLGGTFTNFKTIQKTIRKMEKLQEQTESPDFQQSFTKKERLMQVRELEKLTKLFTGIKDMKKLPEAVFVVDANYDETAVKEARKSKVKVFALGDTNTNPALVDMLIPCNDDATKAIELVLNVIADSYIEGRGKLVTTSVSEPRPEIKK